MSDLFTTRNEVTQDDCITYVRNLVKRSVNLVPWQGYHSYNLLLGAGCIFQFRSKVSALHLSMRALAKEFNRHIAPAITCEDLMPNSSASIWIMEALPSVGYLFTFSSTTVAKQDTTLIDMAR